MMCFSYRGGGWRVEYNLFKKTKGFSVFFFQYFKFEGRDGGGGGYINESLYRESKD